VHELDAKIAHCVKLIDPAMDRLTTERANQFLKELRAERALLHPESK
jgi:hypothetical protein